MENQRITKEYLLWLIRVQKRFFGQVTRSQENFSWYKFFCPARKTRFRGCLPVLIKYHFNYAKKKATKPIWIYSGKNHFMPMIWHFSAKTFAKSILQYWNLIIIWNINSNSNMVSITCSFSNSVNFLGFRWSFIELIAVFQKYIQIIFSVDIFLLNISR